MSSAFYVQLLSLLRISTACRQLEFGVQAIFGPCDPLLSGHIQSICEALDIPHIEARIDFESFKEFSINLHPSQQHINSAYKDLMSFLNWTKVAIIYEEDVGELLPFIQVGQLLMRRFTIAFLQIGLFRQQEFLRSSTSGNFEMYIRQAGPTAYRQVLKEIRQKDIYKIIVDTNPSNIYFFFRAVSQSFKYFSN